MAASQADHGPQEDCTVTAQHAVAGRFAALASLFFRICVVVLSQKDMICVLSTDLNLVVSRLPSNFWVRALATLLLLLPLLLMTAMFQHSHDRSCERECVRK